MQALDALLIATGCPEDVAKAAIDSARYYFDDPEQDIADCILDWHDYAQSKHGKGITHLGKFIASRVRKLRQPPLKARQDRLLREFVRLLLLDPDLELPPPPPSVPVVRRHG